MFYFPSNKPLLTEYPNNIKYLIDRITYNDENINPDSFINKIRLKDKFNISNYDISSACNVSLGTVKLRLALARTKAFLGGVPLTLKSAHNCYEFQNDIEESATVNNIKKYINRK